MLTISIALASGDTLNFTIDEAIDYALENNREIKQLTIEHDRAQARVGEALSAFYPTLSTSGFFVYLTDVPVLALDSIPIPMGRNENYNVQVSLQQVLFAWGKIYNAYRITDISQEIVKLKLERKQQETRYSVTNAFYGILTLEELVKLTEESHAQLKRHENAVRIRYQNGLVSHFDLLRAQVQVANLRAKVIEAENGLRIAREGFKLLLGVPLNNSIVVSGELKLDEETFDLETLTSTALTARAEIKNLQHLENISRLSLAITRRANLPTLFAGAQYERKKPFSFTGNEWGSNITFNVGVQFNIFDGFKNFYQEQQASLALKEARLALEGLREAITLQVKQAYLNFLAARDAAEAARENVSQAQKAFEIVETRYKNGLATNLEYFDAQLALMQAKTNHLSALKNYNGSKAEIYSAIGKEE